MPVLPLTSARRIEGGDRSIMRVGSTSSLLAQTLRKGRVIIIGAAGAMIVALLAAHAPPMRALVFRRVVEALRTSFGIDLRAASLSYNLLTLSAELRRIQIASVRTPAEPFAAADVLTIAFGPRTLVGDVTVRRLSIVSPRVDIRRHDDGTDNLPRASLGRSSNGSFALPLMHVDDLDISFQQSSMSAVVRDAALQLTRAESGRISATLQARHGVTVNLRDRTIDLDAAASTVDLDGEQLAIRELTASRPGSVLHATGRLALRGDASTVDITVNGSSELHSWWEHIDRAWPEGRLDATARVTGLCAEPTITFESHGSSLAWAEIAVSQLRARGSYQGGQLSLTSLTLGVAGGTVEGHGTIAMNDTRISRIEAQWTNIDARHIRGAPDFARTIAPSGTAVVEWRADGTSALPRVDLMATTAVAAARRTLPIVIQGWGRGDQWHLKASGRDTSVVNTVATADIGFDWRRWRASTIDGRMVLRTTDVAALMRQLQDFGIAADIDPSTAAAGAIDVEASLEGTLGAMRSSGRLVGHDVTVVGLPRLDLDASFAVDVDRKTSTGTIRVVAPGLQSATFGAASELTFGGSLDLSGTWSGLLSDPAVDAIVTGTNLTIARAGSVSIAATGGTFDGVLNGFVRNLRGGGKLSMASMAIGGRDAGGVTAELTLADGRARIEARASRVNTALDASISLVHPNAFEGHGTLKDCELQPLLDLLGSGRADHGSIQGSISSSIAFKGELGNLSATDVTLDVAPIDAKAFDVPIAVSHGLRASMTAGRVRLEDVAVTMGSLAVRLGGTLATDRSIGRLVLDVDGDLGSFAPWLPRLSGSADVAAEGRVTGHIEADASPVGLAATGTIDTTLSVLSKGDRLLAKDVRAAIVLTGQRAEVRKVTGTVLGGHLDAAGDAPLSWLNQWLPSSVHVAQSLSDGQATLNGTWSVDVPALFSLFGRKPMETVGGSIALSAALSSSTPNPSDVTGDISLERAEVSANTLRYSQSEVTRFRLSQGALAVETLDWRGPGSKVVGRGNVGLLEGVATDVRLEVDTELGIVGALLSGRATGRLQGNIALHGQSSALQVTSDATLSDVTWLIPGQRILFAGWSGQIRLADQALSVTKLGGTVNGGSIRIDGRLPFEAGADGGGLTIVARDILIDVPRGLHSQLGAELVWQRTDRHPQLQGKVEITANRYTEPVTRILQLVNSLSSATRRSGESTLPSWLAGTTLDITLAITDPILIDNSVGTVELMPDLRLAGTIDSPALSGRVDVVDEGRITIGGRAYRLRDSQLRFAPADGLMPTLDAVGDTRIGDYDVTIRITGTPDRIETSFSSVPPLGERELQSLIVTGQTGEQSTQSRQTDENFAAAAAATDILGFAGRFVGLDTVRIGAADLDLVSKDVSTAQHLTISKSFGAAFDLIFSDNLEDGSVTWVLVWKPTPVNEVRVSSVEDGTRALEFRRTMVFGPGSPARTTKTRRADAQSRTIVDAVRITGAPGFSQQELSAKLAIDAGDRFDVRQWIEDRHRLETFYLKRGYRRVRIASSRSEAADRSRVSLTYDILRGPRTIIDTTGDRLPEQVLDAMYDAWRGLPIADVVRTEFERIAREGLARRGYYRPTLQLDFATETPDLARVTLHVSRGPQTKHLVIAWRGNRDVSNAELDALVAPHRAESAVWLDVQAIAWQVRQLYASRGHLHADVIVGAPAFEATDATLPIDIDEGVLSRIAGVEIEGVDPARRTAATEALGLSLGEPFAAGAPVEAARRLKAFYAGLGYRRAAVTHTLTTAQDGSVAIAWVVKEGPLYRVKDVNVVGADTTSEGLVRKAVTVAPGDAMSQNAIDSTRRNLYDIGSFRRVDFDFGDSAIESGATGELPLTLTIQAEEPQRFQLKYGVQFSSDRSTGKGGRTALGASVELRDRNFIGRAVQASIGAHWDPDLQIIGLLFSSPRLFGKPVRTNVYARDRREQDVLDASSTLEGATLHDRRHELTLEQRWRPAARWELVWGYNLASRRFLIDRNDQHVDAGGLLAGPVVSVILDRRDSPFDAKRGLFHSSSFQFGAQSLGSDLGYVRYLLRQSYYQPIGKLTVAGSVRYGTIRDYSGRAPISIIDLFFNAGGTNTVRGYPEDSLSAINIAGFALGGTDLLVLNGELRFPLTKRLGGAAFVDAGNTFASIADVTLGRLAVGAGVGVRIRTPLAPFRLDVAYPFSDAYGAHGVRVHFSIGQMF